MTDRRKADVTETGSLTEWRSEVLPMFDNLSQRATYAGSATRLKAVITHLTQDTVGPFIVCSFSSFCGVLTSC